MISHVVNGVESTKAPGFSRPLLVRVVPIFGGQARRLPADRGVPARDAGSLAT